MSSVTWTEDLLTSIFNTNKMHQYGSFVFIFTILKLLFMFLILTTLNAILRGTCFMINIRAIVNKSQKCNGNFRRIIIFKISDNNIIISVFFRPLKAKIDTIWKMHHLKICNIGYYRILCTLIWLNIINVVVRNIHRNPPYAKVVLWCYIQILLLQTISHKFYSHVN